MATIVEERQFSVRRRAEYFGFREYFPVRLPRSGLWCVHCAMSGSGNANPDFESTVSAGSCGIVETNAPYNPSFPLPPYPDWVPVAYCPDVKSVTLGLDLDYYEARVWLVAQRWTAPPAEPFDENAAFMPAFLKLYSSYAVYKASTGKKLFVYSPVGPIGEEEPSSETVKTDAFKLAEREGYNIEELGILKVGKFEGGPPQKVDVKLQKLVPDDQN